MCVDVRDHGYFKAYYYKVLYTILKMSLIDQCQNRIKTQSYIQITLI